MKSNGQDRFRGLADRITPPVASYLARRLYPLAAAELDDLVEEVLITVWRRSDAIPVDAEIAWAIGVARNVRRNAVRKYNNGQTAYGQLPAAPVAPSAEDNVVADDSVRRALETLSDDDRDLLLLHYWDGVATPDLAIILGISANAAAVRLTRALQRFEKQFDNVQVS